MKSLLLTVMLCLSISIARGQDFSVVSAGQGNNGEYIVSVIVSTKKKPNKEAEKLAKEFAVRGVMFRGVSPYKEHPGQKPLISDPAIEKIKEPELQAFWNEGIYLSYTSLQPGTLSVLKNMQTKMYETSATLIVDKESLVKWLENNGIIKGFSNLW